MRREQKKGGTAVHRLLVALLLVPVAARGQSAASAPRQGRAAEEEPARWHFGGSVGLVGLPNTYWQFATVGINWTRLAPRRLGGVVELAVFPGITGGGPYAALASGAFVWPIAIPGSLLVLPRAGVTAIAGRPERESSLLLGLHVGGDASFHTGRALRIRASVTRDHFILEKSALWRVQLGMESARGWLARPW